MINILTFIPDIEPAEMAALQQMMEHMSEEQASQFLLVYRARRKEPMLILATALVGLVCFAGVQRFVLGQVGMGILYFLTVGFCFIGTIIDIVNYKRLTYEHNLKEAQMVQAMLGIYPNRR